MAAERLRERLSEVSLSPAEIAHSARAVQRGSLRLSDAIQPLARKAASRDRRAERMAAPDFPRAPFAADLWSGAEPAAPGQVRSSAVVPAAGGQTSAGD